MWRLLFSVLVGVVAPWAIGSYALRQGARFTDLLHLVPAWIVLYLAWLAAYWLPVWRRFLARWLDERFRDAGGSLARAYRSARVRSVRPVHAEVGLLPGSHSDGLPHGEGLRYGSVRRTKSMGRARGRHQRAGVSGRVVPLDAPGDEPGGTEETGS